GYIPEGGIIAPPAADETEVSREVVRLARAGARCNEAYLGIRDGQWTHGGDAVDVAFLVLAEKVRALGGEALGPGSLEAAGSLPFESQRAYAATAYRLPDGETVVYVKGAPEKVLAMCKAEPHIAEQAVEIANSGYRVLAL